MNPFSMKMLLVTDESRKAALAVRVAADLSSKTGSELYIVHVWSAIHWSTALSVFPQNHVAVCEKNVRDLLAAQIRYIEAVGGIVCDTYLECKEMINFIPELGEKIGAGLVIVGGHNHGFITRLVTNDIAENIIRHSRCPVLIARGDENAWPPAQVVICEDAPQSVDRVRKLAVDIGKMFGSEIIYTSTYAKLPGPMRKPRLIAVDSQSSPLLSPSRLLRGMEEFILI